MDAPIFRPSPRGKPLLLGKAPGREGTPRLFTNGPLAEMKTHQMMAERGRMS